MYRVIEEASQFLENSKAWHWARSKNASRKKGWGEKLLPWVLLVS